MCHGTNDLETITNCQTKAAVRHNTKCRNPTSRLRKLLSERIESCHAGELNSIRMSAHSGHHILWGGHIESGNVWKFYIHANVCTQWNDRFWMCTSRVPPRMKIFDACDPFECDQQRLQPASCMEHGDHPDGMAYRKFDDHKNTTHSTLNKTCNGPNNHNTQRSQHTDTYTHNTHTCTNTDTHSYTHTQNHNT